MRRLSSILLPPDFYPERRIDSATWVEAAFEPVALIGAVVCFVLGIVQLGQAIAPDWPTRFLPPLSILVGIEAFLYSRRLSFTTLMPKEWLVLLTPIVVLARFLPYLDDPTSSLGLDLPRWLENPGSYFTLAFVADVIALFAVWVTVLVCTQYLNQLRIQPGEIVDESNIRLRPVYEDSFRAIDHSLPLRELGQLFIWGGVILVLLSSLAALGTAQVFSLEAVATIVGFQRPSLHLVQLNVILYFVLGLLLLGECHFVRQRTLWRLDRLAVPGDIPGRWVSSLLGLVGIALVLAFVLPTSYAMTLGDVIRALIFLVSEVFLLIGAAIFFVIFFLLSLLGQHGGSASPQAPLTPPRLSPTAAPPPGHSPLDTVGSLIFWLVALGIVVYSGSVLWRRRPAWLNHFPLAQVVAGPWRILLALLRLTKRLGREVGRAIAAAVPRLFHPSAQARPRPFKFVSLSRLGPRELVEYFYLSVCERAASLGLPRPPGLTPTEYQLLLRASLPVVDPEIDALTRAFVEARYGPRPTTKEQAQRVRLGWQALKAKLRQARVARLGRRA
jgi:hypothetical protein